jgi:hypothetical protein
VFASLGELLALAMVACTVAGCGDSGEPEWLITTPDTVVLYSLSRAEHFGMPSGFDMVYSRRVVIEGESETGNWDLAVFDDTGSFHIFMPGAFAGLDSTSSIIRVEGTPFDGLAEAPRTGYDSAGLAIDANGLYVVRTRTVTDAYGNACHYFGKLEPVEIDGTNGTLTFRYLSNPNCSSRALTPPD